MSGFEEHGRMFARGKVLKMRFKITNSSELNFFMFAEDVKKLMDGSMYYVRIFLDKEVKANGEKEKGF